MLPKTTHDCNSPVSKNELISWNKKLCSAVIELIGFRTEKFGNHCCEGSGP